MRDRGSLEAIDGWSGLRGVNTGSIQLSFPLGTKLGALGFIAPTFIENAGEEQGFKVPMFQSKVQGSRFKIVVASKKEVSGKIR